MGRGTAAALLFVVFAGLAVVLTMATYQKPPDFPRRPEQFAPPDQLRTMLLQGQEALDTNPDDIRALVHLALARFQQQGHHFEGACPDPKSDPEHYQRSHHYLEGLQLLERARILGAADARLFYYAGVMYEGEGLPAYAQREYEKYLRNDPSDLDVRLRLANLLYRQGHLEEAIDHYQEASLQAPKDPLVAFNLGVAFSAKGMYPEAQKVLERARQNGHSLPPLGNYHLGRAYAMQGNHAKALEHLLSELPASANFLPLHELLAETYEALGDLRSASASWERALEVNPHHRQARKKIQELSRRIAKEETPGR